MYYVKILLTINYCSIQNDMLFSRYMYLDASIIVWNMLIKTIKGGGANILSTPDSLCIAFDIQM